MIVSGIREPAGERVDAARFYVLNNDDVMDMPRWPTLARWVAGPTCESRPQINTTRPASKIKPGLSH
jgi:hypothetical protein